MALSKDAAVGAGASGTVAAAHRLGLVVGRVHGLGGVLAVADRRYRARATASEPAVAQGSAAEAT